LRLREGLHAVLRKPLSVTAGAAPSPDVAANMITKRNLTLPERGRRRVGEGADPSPTPES
jgi:hypothetical protein